ncbi:UPF0489 family protein [Bacillus sp. ES1-5]|uniref:UPF0489 family protein n=1 Tax=Bacillus sp. ES1-5 TaxID=1502999 RepID=UPI001F0C6635|nr:UPF0489 family protein [Bacillus sp. ES1-5]
MFKHETINNKDIYIVDDHHHALEPWAIYRKESHEAPILVTLDHHTDRLNAFLKYCYWQYKGENDENDRKREECREIQVQHIDYNDMHTVKSAINNLRFDEHIDTAIKSNIIKNAFIINYQESNDIPSTFKDQKRVESIQSYEAMLAHIKGIEFEVEAEEGYPIPEDGMYIIGAKCWVGETENHPAPHNNDCIKPHYDQAIESIYLEDKLDTINKMMPDFVMDHQFTKDYILDIDLDYFHTLKSIQPESYDIFYNLIRNAKIITIATEADCVAMGKYEGEKIDSKLLLTKLLDHITKALS